MSHVRLCKTQILVWVNCLGAVLEFMPKNGTQAAADPRADRGVPPRPSQCEALGVIVMITFR